MEIQQNQQSAVTLIEIDCAYLLQLMQRSSENQNYKNLLTFLTQTISGFSKVSRVKRDRIARAFKEKVYPPGHFLVREGVP